MAIKNAISDYLLKFGEPLAQDIVKTLPKRLIVNHCLVIPTYQESPSFWERLSTSDLVKKPVLIIVIINQPQSDKLITPNQTLWDKLAASGDTIHSAKQYQLQKLESSYLLIVDCFKEGNRLPEKQGVGLARKIGCDIACYLFNNKQLNSQWIHTSDADTYLPENYFSVTDTQKTYTAAIYPFQHVGEDNSVTQATKLYEKSINHYVAQLNWAGSPYGFHTLGSCIAVNPLAYAQARGFPKRSGGEDFYLLNKLAKLGNIQHIKNCLLKIESRESDRTPFGTGPAIKKILQMTDPNTEFTGYNPEIFKEVKQLLIQFEELFMMRHQPENWLLTLPEPSQKSLLALKIDRLFGHIQKQAKTKEQALTQCHHWFDAFKTLKFIHLLETAYPKVPLAKL